MQKINSHSMLNPMKKRIYLDAAAAHPVRPAAVRAFMRALSAYGNPSAPHQEGGKAAAILEKARVDIAKETGAKPDALVFTGGATESNALAIVGHIKARMSAGAMPEELHIVYSPTQHASTIGAVKEIEAFGVRTTALVHKDNDIDWQQLQELLAEGVALITLDVVCSETGVRYATRRVRKLIDELPLAKRPVFHVDATQAPLTELMERTRLGADLITFDAQKIGGMRGIGLLVAPRNIPLIPLVAGGGQERGLRSGTPSPSLAAAFAAALIETGKKRTAFAKKAARLTNMMKELVAGMKDVVVNEGVEMAPNILNLSILGRDTDYLAALLDEAGFAVSTKSACETDAAGSRVVAALTGDAARAASTLRISLHDGVSEKDVRMFMSALHTAVTFVDAH